MEYIKWDLGVDWYQKEKKIVTELGHSDRLKIYVSPRLILWNHCTLMVLKFHMQHDKAAGLQNDKIQAVWESKMVAKKS